MARLMRALYLGSRILFDPDEAGMARDLFGLLDTTGFPARWHCGRWSSELGWLHIVSDALIFLASPFYLCEMR